ncbi:bacteriocin immunity protein [Liquorilactobacillus sicerae]|uniref:bacteriocin immunity protein n=1 Tax=Liquorilactobacillus sicerae TaxID=1416943 RepID=UPI0024817444|nr:bacteriocin immunity protein [Liquorilactobacillus sicerae]
MIKQNAVQQLLDQLSQTYSDPEVKRFPAIQRMIFASAQELEKSQDCGLVATKLCKEIVLYYWSHQSDFPKALILLHHQIKSRAVKYDATAITAMMLPLWL